MNLDQIFDEILFESARINTDYSILLLTDRVANWKIQNGPFGTLSEPELSQKKCSEELRSRSIDW